MKDLLVDIISERDIPRPTIMLCPACNGTGEVAFETELTGHDYGLCDVCQGTGKLTIAQYA